MIFKFASISTDGFDTNNFDTNYYNNKDNDTNLFESQILDNQIQTIKRTGCDDSITDYLGYNNNDFFRILNHYFKKNDDNDYTEINYILFGKRFVLLETFLFDYKDGTLIAEIPEITDNSNDYDIVNEAGFNVSIGFSENNNRYICITEVESSTDCRYFFKWNSNSFNQQQTVWRYFGTHNKIDYVQVINSYEIYDVSNGKLSFIYDDSEQKKLTNINVYVKSNGNLTEYTQSVYNNINDYNFITINNVPYKTDGSRLYSYTDFEN